MLHRNSGVPLYIQIRHDIESRIRKGEWKPSHQIPTEEELQTIYGVSRITVQRAVIDLVRAGLLIRTPGKGTFVSNTIPEQNLLEFINFVTEEQAIEGPHRVITSGVVTGDNAVAAMLKVAPNEPIVRLERIKLSEDVPVALEVSYVPLRFAPDLLEQRLDVLNPTLSRQMGWLLRER
ncbi:GntR family transcriptional regulator [Alicyclobacillus macrosporangiidus]|uniref:GntR family transcriptional regulator/GntR family transcriptional regulator, histidine utilization repressor n=1 Tax=Alicyclobacillus macrosporangiidus TaxID=392015 RepID=A0A1I7LDU1_9BACL|nr:GntR family transcriptional regulator [Alicyclobacillus macrosporangiidus]SFV07744.1 GntR family transcriptional regulator/GntR family transcriptional regulator, histidine utilization repressor [Alicyclobacillus macrosporangiidus]